MPLKLISERTRIGLERTKSQGTILGRPKGSKDSKPRPKSGYLMREVNKRKSKDAEKRNFKSVESYIK